MVKATLTPTPTPDGPGRYLTPPFMAELEGSVRAGFHVMLMGPRGTGKTTAVRLIARKFGKRLFTIQGHSDLTVEELRGVPGLHGGNSTFVPSPVVHAVREGAFLLLDEANLCRPGVTAWLNNILDQEGVLSIPETGDLLAVPADFRAFLCFNAGYQGTRQLNEALVDRCRVIYCKYWPEAEEKKLLSRRLPRLKTIDLDRMVRVANGVRAPGGP